MDLFEILLVGMILIFVASIMVFIFMYTVTREKKYQIIALVLSVFNVIFMLLFIRVYLG